VFALLASKLGFSTRLPTGTPAAAEKAHLSPLTPAVQTLQEFEGQGDVHFFRYLQYRLYCLANMVPAAGTASRPTVAPTTCPSSPSCRLPVLLLRCRAHARKQAALSINRPALTLCAP
jgi:hypothetical protein